LNKRLVGPRVGLDTVEGRIIIIIIIFIYCKWVVTRWQ
jgi:hypothetical protein